MTQVKLFALALILIVCSSCVKEKDLTPDCAKWEIEINNPEATVEISDGKIIVDIPYPQSSKDVRLIQRQDVAYTSAEVGAWVQLSRFESTPVDEYANDAHIMSSFAYVHQPEVPFVSLATGDYGKRGYYLGEDKYFDTKKLSSNFYGKAGTLQFEVSHAPNAVQEVSPISAAAKLYYLDFGVNPTWTRGRPTAHMHVEVDMVVFGNYVDRPAEPLDGFPDKALGFVLDMFDCNSLIK